MSTLHPAGLASALARISPFDLVPALLSSPVVSAALAVVAAVAIAVITHRAGGVAVAGPRGERVALAGVACAVGVVWLLDVVLRGYVFDMSATVSWWRFAVAPTAAAVGLALLAIAMRTKRPRRSIDPAMAVRRTWTSFGPRRGILSFAVLGVVAIAVALVFGAMSTAFEPGLAAHVALDLPNTDEPPVVLPFPGWAYGIPLIVSVVALAAAMVFALRRNAVRPFPDEVPLDVERVRRASVARDAVVLAAGATLIALAGMLRLARSAVTTSVTIMTDSGTGPALSADLPHADLILLGGVIAPGLEIGGCLLLALLVTRGVRIAATPRRRTVAAAEVQV
ncbi:MAG: non-ribosomal peptide synthetase [Microbacterium sp.]|jgi:hypothetical protein|nr:non-ribosomal peptide synthetase [Microbacterium sp.]